MVWVRCSPRPALFCLASDVTSPTAHVPVLVEAVLTGLKLDVPRDPSSKRVMIDGTLGGAGHSMRMATCLSVGETLITMDRDPSAIQRMLPFLQAHLGVTAEQTDLGWSFQPANGCRWILCADSYCAIPRVLQDLGIASADGILLDLGLSSDQLQDTERGFSFRVDGPLDLRFDPNSGLSAADFLRVKTEKEIADTIYRFGEERFSRRIARAIVEMRLANPIETSKQLADLIHRVVPGRIHGRVDSATRTFQALRIAVNRELEHVEQAMQSLPRSLSPEGRLVVISFHSLEDRIVKHSMRENALLEVLTKKPIVADLMEMETNPRSRSAKLRVAERLPD